MDEEYSTTIIGAPLARSRTSNRVQKISGHVTQTTPFCREVVEEHINLEESAYLELLPMSKAYGLVCAYIAAKGEVNSFRYAPECMFDPEGDDDLPAGGNARACSLTTLGLGFFSFPWRHVTLHALHQAVGQPVGMQCGVDIFRSLILFGPKSNSEVLGEFCHELVMESERSRPGQITVFQWETMSEFWGVSSVCPARPIDSVVLESSIKNELIRDMEEFLSPETRQWYRDHGIPHKRGFLFHGVPGTGKTSMIQALAGRFERNLCYVHLTHPRLTDESLRMAVNQAPSKSILVLEDVDAVFSKDREKTIKDSPLTFSGLLNALDGVGKADGQIFILTTNHRERLNPALIRNGRADVHIEFTHATDDQIAQMFGNFYPMSTVAMAQKFVENVREALRGRLVTCAALQHYFILHRKSSAATALDLKHVKEIAREIDLRADEQHQRQQDEADKKSRENAPEGERRQFEGLPSKL